MSFLFSAYNGRVPVPVAATNVGLTCNQTERGEALAVVSGATHADMSAPAFQLRSVPASATSMSNTFELVPTPKPETAHAKATAQAQAAAAATAQWNAPSLAAGGATNLNSYQSYNMLVKQQNYTAVGAMPRTPLPGPGFPGFSAVSPLEYAASALPSMYGGSLIGNPAKTATFLAPTRAMIFNNTCPYPF